MKITKFDDFSTLDWIARVAAKARDNGQSLSLSQGHDETGGSYIKFKLGESMWSAPIYSTDDEPAYVTPRLSVGTNGEPVVS